MRDFNIQDSRVKLSLNSGNCLKTETHDIVRTSFYYLNDLNPVMFNKMVKCAVARQQQCSYCPLKVAVSHCSQCGDWLCDECQGAHRRFRISRDHQLITLEEAQTQEEAAKG